MIAPAKVVAASLMRTVATAVQSKQLVAMAIFIIFIVHLRAETIWSYAKIPTGLFPVPLRHLPTHAAVFLPPNWFAKDCEQVKLPILHRLSVSWLSVRI